MSTEYNQKLAKLDAGYHMQACKDIRTIYCGASLSFEIQSGWTPIWVRLNNRPSADDHTQKQHTPAGGQMLTHLAMNFVSNSHRPRIVQVAPIVQTPPAQAPVGLEYRVMDNCPSKDMIHILRTVALLAAAAHSLEQAMPKLDDVHRWIKKHRALHDMDWNTALVNVSLGGCFSTLPSAYMQKVRKMCGLDMRKMTRTKQKQGDVAAYPALVHLCAALFRSYGEHPVFVMLDGGKEDKRAPKPVNNNLKAWWQSFKQMMPGQDMQHALHTRHNRKGWELNMPYIEYMMQHNTEA
jgi:hypothetical protein